MATTTRAGWDKTRDHYDRGEPDQTEARDDDDQTHDDAELAYLAATREALNEIAQLAHDTADETEDDAPAHAWPEWTDANCWVPTDDATPPAALPLADRVDAEANRHRARGTPLGTLCARALDQLALQLRMTEAETVADFEVRLEGLDDSIRAEWIAQGYEEGRRVGCVHRDAFD